MLLKRGRDRSLKEPVFVAKLKELHLEPRVTSAQAVDDHRKGFGPDLTDGFISRRGALSRPASVACIAHPLAQRFAVINRVRRRTEVNDKRNQQSPNDAE